MYHKNVHEEWSHKCIVCEAGFANAKDLKSHSISVHNDTKPFKCLNCSDSFRRKGELTKHEQRYHEEKETKKYECLLCDVNFTKELHLTTHNALTHCMVVLLQDIKDDVQHHFNKN